MQLQHLLPHQLQQAIRQGWPLLVPAGCIEYHGPHLPLGVDTLIVEELCSRVARRVDAVVAPPFWYGPTGYAVTGPDQGTVDVSTERFGRHAKDVLGAFWDIGFKWIIVCQHHQSVDGPEALAIRQAAAEVAFEKTLAERGKGWWGRNPLPVDDNVFERIQVWPSVLPPADKVATLSDHAGFYETALILGARPDLVDLDRLGMNAPWYTHASSSSARRATQEAGARMWSAMVDAWVDKLAALTKPRRPTPKDVTITGLF
ncbi:MAG: creatininase family protein [Anaerolineae bacterium]|jgi:creatinine amidohydrolase|nr:creatininase family protein [Anaerolineae bacterium]